MATDLPRNAEGFYQDVRLRVALHRAHRDWRETRRAQRLGTASYRDVRAALKAHRKTQSQTEARTAALYQLVVSDN